MKKQQKIIELRTKAKRKVAELETKIAFARSEAAGKRASVLTLRANVLKGMEAGSTERLDAIAKYAAIKSEVQARLEDTVAQLKFEIQQVKAECEKQCAAAEDDPETMTKLPQQTVYCDGSEHSARIVARRLINKMPHIPIGGYLFVHIISDNDDGEYFVGVSGAGRKLDDYISTVFSKGDGEKEEEEFVKEARRLFAEEQESGNSHVAEPMSRALDAVFGGNQVEQVDNLIADTVKKGKDGENE